MEDSPIRAVADARALHALRERAYRLLARREYSCYELRRKLTPHDGHGQLDLLLDTLDSEGSLSDRRFAEQLGRSRYQAGKGPRLLEQELRRHRLDEDIVQEVMSQYRESWRDLAAEVRQKRFGTAPPEDYRAWAKQARFLQQRGFTADEIGSYDES